MSADGGHDRDDSTIVFEDFSEPDPLLSISSSGAYLWPALLRVCTVLLCLMSTLLACMYVLSCRSRLPTFCGVRVLLCLSMLLWVACALAARRSLWDLILVPLGVRLPSATDFELFCGVHSVIEYGVAEPLALTLIALVFQAKARRSSATPTRPWRIVRCALAISLAAGMLHSSVFLVDRYVPTQNALGPHPRMRAPSLPPPAAPRLASPTPMPPSAPGATRLVWGAHRWWLAEGCGTTYSAVALTALFVICFEVAWTAACQRLVGTILNLKMRARLRLVQLTFTLVPLLLLLVRAVLLVVPVHWPTFRRFLRDGELLVILLATVAASWALVCRPVLEGAAPSASSASHGEAFPSEDLGFAPANTPSPAGGAAMTLRGRTCRLESAAAWLSALRSGGRRSSAGSELGASIGSCESPRPWRSGAETDPHGQAEATPKSASPWSSPMGGLLFLGRHSKAASRRPTLSVAVDLNEDAQTPAQDESQQVQIAAEPLAMACDQDTLPHSQPLPAPATPARIASRLQRARSMGKSATPLSAPMDSSTSAHPVHGDVHVGSSSGVT